ncbi:MAG: glycosyltransferase family 2 protein [Thaumarchaeota archaeon]|nr:glycosyltransferase family 2 protein [Nitrososphaerota archaeon]
MRLADEAPIHTQDVQAVDVVVLTKNSEKTLALCLDAIERSVNLSSLIIIDGGSEDKTLAIASGRTPAVQVLPSLNVGQARDYALDLIHTETFAFVDSDVVVNRQSFLKSVQMLSRDVFVAAVTNAMIPADSRLRKPTERPNRPNYLTFGFVLLRTSALRRCRIPGIPWGEDGRTGKRLEKLGFNWLIQNEFYCRHLITMQEHWYHALRYARLGYPWIKPKKIPLLMVKDVVKIGFPLGDSRRPSLNNLVFCGFVLLGLLERLVKGERPLSFR